MGVAAFTAGALVDTDGSKYRLRRKVTDTVWQLEDTKTGRITERTDTELRQLYAAGELIFAVAESRHSTDAQHVELRPLPSDKEFEAAKIRRLYAKAAAQIPVTKAALTPVIKSVWEKVNLPKSPPSWISVFRWKKRLEQAGDDVSALANNYNACGNRMCRYPVEVIEFAEAAIDAVYLRPERNSIQATVDHAVASALRENRQRPAAAQLPLPTRRLLKRMIDQIPAFDRYAARHGKLAATKRFRAVQAHRTTLVPLERAEIDHTPLDLMVIDDKTGLPLGRPWLTACLDDYTRTVLGLYLGFEHPSYFTVACCLKHAFLPKDGLANTFPNIKNEWQAHGVMRELVVDNGTEFHSVSLENACLTLGIEIHYSARKTPWFKGKIERFLGTLNREVAHGRPGTTFSNIFEKEDYDPSKHAVIRYSRLREIVYTWVADVYHQKPHRTLGIAPAVMWSKSVKQEDIMLPANPERLDAILGRHEKRRLTHKGIELYGLLYNSPELTELRYRLGDTLDVEIRVDASNLGQIVVLSPDQDQTYVVPALDADYATGISEWQHRIFKRFAANEGKKYSSTSWIEAKARIAALVDEEFMYKKQRTRSKIARYKGDRLLPSDPAASQVKQIRDNVAGVVAGKNLPNSQEKPVVDVTVNERPKPVKSISESVLPEAARKRFSPVYRERARGFDDDEPLEGLQR